MTASAQECLACSEDINLITAAKLLAKLQQLWCYSVWLRLFWRQLRLTFCTSRWPQSYQSSMSALPPKADICSALAYVRFGPKAGIALCNHLGGERDQRRRYGEAEGLGGLEVNYEIKFCGLHNRQVGWLLALENSGGIDTSLAIGIGYARPIAHQATHGNELA